MPYRQRPDSGAPPESCTQIAIDDGVVHVIQSSYHFRDVDNYPKTEEELQVDEGWFATAEAAQARCDQLNARNRTRYETAMTVYQRKHDALVEKALLTNREAAAIRDAGLKKNDVPVPGPFVAEQFETFLQNNSYTTFETIPIRHSDHDGLARACGVPIPEPV